MRVHFDFETYSECDLRSAGAWIYAAHPSTEVLCMAYAYDGSDPLLWRPGEPLPDFAIHPEHYELHAWNSAFEHAIWVNCLKWADAPMHLWHDTMALAAAAALPMRLGNCAIAMGLPTDAQKDKRGSYLISRLSKPNRGQRVHDFVLLQEMEAYCRQDVVVEREISRLLRPLNAFERQVWVLDQEINARGVHLDRVAAEAIVAGVTRRSTSQEESFSTLTDGAVSSPRSYVALRDWVNIQTGMKLETIDKRIAAELLGSGDLPEKVRGALEIKAELSRSSVAKFKAILSRTTPEDWRARCLFQYHGAATGRWAGRGIQLQNLPRASYDEDDYEQGRRQFLDGDLETINVLFDTPYDAASHMLRGTICAPDGKELLCADYASIESRALAYLAGEQWVLDAYREGKDMYKVTAAKILNKRYEDVTKAERNALGKPALLGAGYGGSSNAIRNVGGGKGMTDEEIVTQIIKPWRTANAEIVTWWYDIERAAKLAVERPGRKCEAGPIAFKAAGSFLFCRLPSSRYLSYFRPSIEDVETPWGEVRKGVTYMGMKIAAGKTTTVWGPVATRGPKLVENIVQGFCRDLLAAAMLRLDEAGFTVVAHVHDEIIAEEVIGVHSLDAFCSIMAEAPEWAAGMPIDVEGWAGKRYRK